MKDWDIAEVAILIVGFHNPVDIARCIAALSSAMLCPNFDVFICENGGRESYEQLIGHLTDASAPCRLLKERSRTDAGASGLFLATERFRFPCRPSNVNIGCATDNLGYAGGINAWLRELVHVGGWKGIWILNPDTEPAPDALAALVSRAELGGKGMVGSTILQPGSDNVIRFRGGLHWQKFAARNTSIGVNEQIGDWFDLSAVEDAMDSPSGASMYVTRRCVEKIGLMDETFFLFDEDLDWGVRAKRQGLQLGYASGSIVAHQGGTTTGSADGGLGMSKLAIYLQHRNAIHFVRRHFPWSLPVRIAISILYALRYLLHRTPGSFVAVLQGLVAGLRGETGKPSWHRKSPGSPKPEFSLKSCTRERFGLPFPRTVVSPTAGAWRARLRRRRRHRCASFVQSRLQAFVVRLEFGSPGDLAADLADGSPEPAAQRTQLAMAAIELPGMGIA